MRGKGFCSLRGQGVTSKGQRGSFVPDMAGRAGLVAGQEPPGERPRPGL